MNKLLSLLLVFLFCLSVVGCKQSPAPTGERNVSSPITGDEISETAPASEDVLPSDMETEAPVSAAQSTNDTDSEVAVPSAPPAKPSETAPATSSNVPVSSTAPATSIPTPVSSETFTPAVFFCPPDHPSVYEHPEYSFDNLIAWINSDKALVEEDGVYRAAVEYWRKRGTVYLATLPQTVSKIEWCKLRSNGRLEIAFEKEGILEICPIDEAEATIVSNGIVPYFEAKGNTVASELISMNHPKVSAPNSASRLAACSIRIQSQPIDAVLEVETTPLYNGSIVYAPYMHWFQDGFRICYIFHVTNTLEEATAVDDFVLSQLQFQDVSLSKTAYTQIK